jgi:hypothetical protein
MRFKEIMDAIANYTITQLNELGAALINIDTGQLTGAQIDGISKEQYLNLNVSQITGSQVKILNSDPEGFFGGLADNASSLSREAIDAISVPQLNVMALKSIGLINAGYIPKDILNGQMGGLKYSVIANLNASQFDAEQIKHMSASFLGALSVARLNTIRTAKFKKVS